MYGIIVQTSRSTETEAAQIVDRTTSMYVDALIPSGKEALRMKVATRSTEAEITFAPCAAEVALCLMAETLIVSYGNVESERAMVSLAESGGNGGGGTEGSDLGGKEGGRAGERACGGARGRGGRSVCGGAHGFEATGGESGHRTWVAPRRWS